MVAMCAGPESGHSSTLERASSASSCGKVSSPIWLITGTALSRSIAAPMSRSNADRAPHRMPRMPCASAACSARPAERSARQLRRVSLRGGCQRQVPFEPAFLDAERAEETLKAVEHVLLTARRDLRIGEQPLQLARPCTIETQPQPRADQRRCQAGTQRQLHVQQYVEAAAV